MKSEIILPHVYLLTYDSQYDLCMSFVRMQEFHESAKFRNKYFTLEEFIDYWAEEFGNGSFDYPARWSGFNLSNKSIEKWMNKFECQEDRFRDRESNIIDEVYKLYMQESVPQELPFKYYFIGVHSGNPRHLTHDIINHECAHALYYLYPAYKKKCNKMLLEIDSDRVNKSSNNLLKMGYGKNVLKDEMQAYFSTEDEVNNYGWLSGVSEFIGNFNKYKKKWSEK